MTSFELRLDEAFNILNKDETPDKLVLPILNIDVTTTNTLWPNVKDLLRRIKRPPMHFIDFLGKHLNTEVTQRTSSLKDGLIIIGKHNKKKVTQLVEKYLTDFVICKSCNSYNSKIKKNDMTRKWEFNCNTCKATYSL